MGIKSIFISHAHVNGRSAICLQKALVYSFHKNVTIFCTSLPKCRFTDKSEKAFGPKLENQLSQADMIIVLASEASKGSPWVTYETVIAGYDKVIFGGSLGQIGEFPIYDMYQDNLKVIKFAKHRGLIEGASLSEALTKLADKFRDKIAPPKIQGQIEDPDPVPLENDRHYFGHERALWPSSQIKWIHAEYPDITKPSGLKTLWKWVELWLEIEPKKDIDYLSIANELRRLSMNEI